MKEYCTNFIEYLNTTRVFSEEQKRANFNQQIETSIKIIQKGIESKWNSVIGAKGSISDSQVKDITEKAIDEMLNDIMFFHWQNHKQICLRINFIKLLKIISKRHI